MRIEKLHIDAFMGTKDRTVVFAPGVNILRGDNESGKSTIAEFIKFMLYGASARGVDGALSERVRYLSFGETAIGGSMQVRTGKGRYSIERRLTAGGSGFRESVSVTDTERKTQVFKGEPVGETLLGIPESVFVKTAYISQLDDGYTGGAELGSAIENLLFSADETVSTDKALKKLDALRVQLLYKNGKGGLLYTCRTEREALAARLEKALAANSEIIAKEGSLAETVRRIGENKTDYARAKKLCALYDNYVARKRFQKLDEVEASLAETAEKRRALDATFDGFVPDGEYLGRLRQTDENVRAQRAVVAEAKTRAENAARGAAAAANAGVSDDTEALRATAKRAHGAFRTGKVLAAVGIVLLVLAALAACGIYLLRLESALYFAAGGAAFVGVLLIGFALFRRKKARAMLAEYGVGTAYELDEKARETAELIAQRAAAIDEAHKAESAAQALLESEERRLRTLETELATEACRLGGSADAPEELLAAVQRYLDASAELTAAEHRLTDRRTALREETAAFDRAAVEETLSAVGDPSVFENIDIAEYSRKRDFCENAIEALEIKRSELEKSLAALHATVEDPARLKSALDALRKREAAAKEKYDAAELAMRALTNASSGLRTRVSPRLAADAGKLMGVMTDGKYTEIGLSDTLAITYMENGSAHEAAFLSRGTRGNAYFALRLALADLLCPEERPPLLLDECFAYTDDTRTRQMLRILAALGAKDTQSLVFTCHKREEKLAESIGVYHLIEL